jgi:hypothetical protein
MEAVAAKPLNSPMAVVEKLATTLFLPVQCLTMHIVRRYGAGGSITPLVAKDTARQQALAFARESFG